MILNYGDTITGMIQNESFDGLKNSIKEEFLEVVRVTSSSDGYIHFEIPNRHAAEQLYEKIRNYDKNKNRTESRNESLNILSSGIYEKEDIDALYEAQEGLCYYTGQQLERKPNNFAVDHVIPVTECGSSWPKNLVLALTAINREKHNHSKRKIFSILEKRNGKEWLSNQKALCKMVDIKRRAIDRRRRALISKELKSVEANVRDVFPGADIEYSLVGDNVELFVNYTVVQFGAGFIRKKRKSLSSKYIGDIVKAILSD
jgi:5-methylcytosine-specific restriction endonuclease McrA